MEKKWSQSSLRYLNPHLDKIRSALIVDISISVYIFDVTFLKVLLNKKF